jgi:hypothetical protein
MIRLGTFLEKFVDYEFLKNNKEIFTRNTDVNNVEMF